VERWLDRFGKIARSLGVGALATVADLLTLAFFVGVLGVSARVASVPALATGIVIQFVGNKLFAFEDRSRRWGKQAALFLCVECVGFAANVLAFDVAVRAIPLPYWLVRLVTTNAVYFAVCLPAWSFIFRSTKEETS
jgi:putative flippase GtrA